MRVSSRYIDQFSVYASFTQTALDSKTSTRFGTKTWPSTLDMVLLELQSNQAVPTPMARLSMIRRRGGNGTRRVFKENTRGTLKQTDIPLISGPRVPYFSLKNGSQFGVDILEGFLG